MQVFIVGPAELVPLYVGHAFAYSDSVEPLHLVGATFEADGVPNPRAYIAHDLSEQAAAYAAAVIKQNGHEGLLEILPRLPSDWRYKVMEGI